MNSYWDLEGADRAALTEEQVERYCDIELMSAGITKPKPLELLPEDPPKLETVTAYAIEVDGRYSSREKLDVLFHDIASANSFLRLAPMIRGHDYGTDEHIKQMAGASIVQIAIPTEATIANRKSEIDKARANKDANEKSRRALKEHAERTRKALEGLWSDYRSQQSYARRMQEVRETFDSYVELAQGNRSAARAFLAKSFPPEAWFGDLVDIVNAAIGPE